MIKSAKLLRVAVLGVALSSIFVLGAAAATLGAGTTTAALRLREAPNTEATTLATPAEGTNVVILEDAKDGWYKVEYQGVEGYMSSEFLTVQTQAELKIGYGLVKTDGTTLNVRAGAGTDFDKVTTLSNGDVVDIIGVDNGWYKISSNGTTGYVSSEFMVTTKDNLSSRGTDAAATTSSDLGSQMVAYAKNFMGVKYVWGGNGPNSFDCSGFTKYVYAHFGYTLNRTASSQLSNGTRVSSMSDLQVGDLVFFNNGRVSTAASHVGIYIGDSQFIHASTNAYKVQIDSLSGYYGRTYIGGRHII